LDNTEAQQQLQVQSMKNVNGLLHIELPGGLMLPAPGVAAPRPPGLAARRRADAVPDHFWMMGGEEGGQRNAVG
jgi:hypothetical protein